MGLAGCNPLLAEIPLFAKGGAIVEARLIHQKYRLVKNVEILLSRAVCAKQMVMPLVFENNQPSKDSTERDVVFCARNQFLTINNNLFFHSLFLRLAGKNM